MAMKKVLVTMVLFSLCLMILAPVVTASNDVVTRGKPAPVIKVVITNPAAGATVSDTVLVTCDQVADIYIGGSLVATGTSYSWDTTAYADGDIVIKAEVSKKNKVSITVTVNNGGGDVNKYARLAAYLARAVTIGTADGRGAWLRSVAATARAGLLARDLDLLLRAKDCFFKLYLQVVAQVGTPARSAAGTSRSHAEAGPKEFLEDFKGVPKAPKAFEAAEALGTGVAEAVVGCPLLLVA